MDRRKFLCRAFNYADSKKIINCNIMNFIITFLYDIALLFLPMLWISDLMLNHHIFCCTDFQGHC